MVRVLVQSEADIHHTRRCAEYAEIAEQTFNDPEAYHTAIRNLVKGGRDGARQLRRQTDPGRFRAGLVAP